MTDQPDDHDGNLDRYARQLLFEPISESGQRRLLQAHVFLVGCGALGTVLAETLVRAGIGFIRIADRDFIELNNLQRQVLFDEDDIAANLPKATAAARKLGRINSDVSVDPVVADINHTNIVQWAEDAELILDGTDNFETRFLINDYCVKYRKPWVYGAVVGVTGLCMPIIPGETPCLRCVFENAPPPEMNPTCDTAGVLGPTVNLVANLQVVESLKILLGHLDQVNRKLVHVDAWAPRMVSLNVQRTYDEGNCPCCHRGEFPYLEGELASGATSLCGRNAVQITPPQPRRTDFAAISEKLAAVAQSPIRANEFMLKTTLDGMELTLFADGRTIVKGTDNVELARSIVARYVG
ncbi:MAG: ThiF family adenylyltransferase [Planctomycetota bacterium]|jgi:adenylyltransferase/sulfurtransferase